MAARHMSATVLALCWIVAVVTATLSAEHTGPESAEVDPDVSLVQRLSDAMATAHRRIMDDTDIFDIYPDSKLSAAETPGMPEKEEAEILRRMENTLSEDNPVVMRKIPVRREGGKVVLLYPDPSVAVPGVVVLYPTPEPPTRDEDGVMEGDPEQTVPASEEIDRHDDRDLNGDASLEEGTDVTEHVKKADEQPEPEEPISIPPESPTEPSQRGTDEIASTSEPATEDPVLPETEGSDAAGEVTFDGEPESTTGLTLLAYEQSTPRPQMESLAPAEEYVPKAPLRASYPDWRRYRPAASAPQYPIWNRYSSRRQHQPWAGGRWVRPVSAAAPWPVADRSVSRALHARTAHPAPWRGAGRPPAGTWPWPALFTSSGGRPAAVPSGGGFPLYSGWRGAGAGYARQYAGTGRFPLYSQWYRPAVAQLPGWPADAAPFPVYRQWPRPAVAMATSESTSPEDAAQDWRWPAVSLAQSGDHLVVTGTGLNSGALARAAGETGWPPVAVATARSDDKTGFARSSSGGFNLVYRDDKFWTEPYNAVGGASGPGAQLLPVSGNWDDGWRGGLMAFTSPGEDYAPPEAVHAREDTDSLESNDDEEGPDVDADHQEQSDDGDELGEDMLDMTPLTDMWDGTVLLVGSWPEPEGSGILMQEVEVGGGWPGMEVQGEREGLPEAKEPVEADDESEDSENSSDENETIPMDSPRIEGEEDSDDEDNQR